MLYLLMIFYILLKLLMNKTRKDFYTYVEQLKEISTDITTQDVMFIWDVAAQAQCNEYNISMYERMKIIAKVFNNFL